MIVGVEVLGNISITSNQENHYNKRQLLKIVGNRCHLNSKIKQTASTNGPDTNAH